MQQGCHVVQEMGFDSIPFEEPELFRVRSGLQALPALGVESSLDLRLDSQDVNGGGFEEEASLIRKHHMSWSSLWC